MAWREISAQHIQGSTLESVGRCLCILLVSLMYLHFKGPFPSSFIWLVCWVRLWVSTEHLSVYVLEQRPAGDWGPVLIPPSDWWCCEMKYNLFCVLCGFCVYEKHRWSVNFQHLIILLAATCAVYQPCIYCYKCSNLLLQWLGHCCHSSLVLRFMEVEHSLPVCAAVQINSSKVNYWTFKHVLCLLL